MSLDVLAATASLPSSFSIPAYIITLSNIAYGLHHTLTPPQLLLCKHRFDSVLHDKNQFWLDAGTANTLGYPSFLTITQVLQLHRETIEACNLFDASNLVSFVLCSSFFLQQIFTRMKTATNMAKGVKMGDFLFKLSTKNWNRIHNRLLFISSPSFTFCLLILPPSPFIQTPFVTAVLSGFFPTPLHT